MVSMLRSTDPVLPMPAQTTQLSPFSTRPSTCNTTVPVLLSLLPMKELRSSEELPLLTDKLSEEVHALKLQSDARDPTDTESALPEKVSILPISSNSMSDTPGMREDATLHLDPPPRSKSSPELPLPMESKPSKVDAKVLKNAENGEVSTSAELMPEEHGEEKRMSTPSEMDTASNSEEPPSEMDKLMPPSQESSPLEELDSKKEDAELPVSPTESGTDKPTVSPSPSGPTELEFMYLLTCSCRLKDI